MGEGAGVGVSSSLQPHPSELDSAEAKAALGMTDYRDRPLTVKKHVHSAELPRRPKNVREGRAVSLAACMLFAAAVLLSRAARLEQRSGQILYYQVFNVAMLFI